MDTTSNSETPQRRVDDRAPAATINWDAPGAPAVPVHSEGAALPADLQQLKALALAITSSDSFTGTRAAFDAFQAGATPNVVLDLIARIERATAPHAAEWNLTDARELLARAQASLGFNDLPQPLPLRVEIDNAAGILARLDAAPHGSAAPTEAEKVPCGACKGTGDASVAESFDSGIHKCSDCNGKGYDWEPVVAPQCAAAPTEAAPTVCTRPPTGWHCTRAPGHEGPCAAVPTEVCADDYTPEQMVIYQHGVEDGKLIARGMARFNAGRAAAPVSGDLPPLPEALDEVQVHENILADNPKYTREASYKSWQDYYTADQMRAYALAAVAAAKVPTVDKLRHEVREMARMLEENEWAEQLTVDPDATVLQSEITRLVGLYNDRLAAPVEQGQGAASSEKADASKSGRKPDGYVYTYQLASLREPGASGLAVPIHTDIGDVRGKTPIFFGSPAPVGAGVVPEGHAKPHTIQELLAIYDKEDGDWCKIARAVEERYLTATPTAATAHPVAADDQLRDAGGAK